MTKLTDRADAAEARQVEWENHLYAIAAPHITRFVRGVVTSAEQALDAPSLLAAADPFAFTNIRARWDTTIRLILNTPRSQLAHPALLDETVEYLFRASDMPIWAADKAVEILTLGRDEEWTKAKIKRQLRANLLPPEPKGVDKKTSGEWSWYKARVRAIARTASTRATSLSILEDEGQVGESHKRWCTRGDARVRDTHNAADDQTVPRQGSFTVGGYPMQYPGDPAGPPEETENCRCVMILLTPQEER